MSLYNHSEEAIIELKEVINSVQNTKSKLNISADNMAKALDQYITIQEPLHLLVNKNLDLEQSLNSNSDLLDKKIRGVKHTLNNDVIPPLSTIIRQLKKADKENEELAKELQLLKKQQSENQALNVKLLHGLTALIVINIAVALFI
ncbi:hypothetical protein [Paraferrimonas sp. SM1919]|uniref:hypothetical protein n=1 Tax=Paraferrimonas sp. SM1919 TaxID=2662263 RepID=UPI0013D867E6|nr:hypothetical protein [Paraferrimonas sp. SM1919]